MPDPSEFYTQCELSYFTSNFNAVLCKIIIFMGYWWTIKKKLPVYFEKGLKEDNCPKYNWSSILFCPAIYCVKQNTVPTLSFNIHLLNFPLLICCSYIMVCIALFLICTCSNAVVISCFALHCPLFKNWMHFFIVLLACKSVDRSTFCMKRFIQKMCLCPSFYTPIKLQKNAFNSYNYI